MDVTPPPATRRVELFDGTAGRLRPIDPADADALRRFHTHLSRSTVRLRFFGLHPELAAKEVDRFTTVDGTDRVAFVIESGMEIIAVGRYDRMEDPTVAEVAFVVDDAHQHHGLGSLLLARLTERAREAGITTLYAQVLAGNGAMLGVFRESRYPMQVTEAFGVIDVTLAITSQSGGGADGSDSERDRPDEAGASSRRGLDP